MEGGIQGPADLVIRCVLGAQGARSFSSVTILAFGVCFGLQSELSALGGEGRHGGDDERGNGSAGGAPVEGVWMEQVYLKVRSCSGSFYDYVYTCARRFSLFVMMSK